MDLPLDQLEALIKSCFETLAQAILTLEETTLRECLQALFEMGFFLYGCLQKALADLSLELEPLLKRSPQEQIRRITARCEDYYSEILQSEAYQNAFSRCFNAYTDWLQAH